MLKPDAAVDEGQQSSYPLAEGRATLVREWLRLLADRSIDPNQLEKICRKTRQPAYAGGADP